MRWRAIFWNICFLFFNNLYNRPIINKNYKNIIKALSAKHDFPQGMKVIWSGWRKAKEKGDTYTLIDLMLIYKVKEDVYSNIWIRIMLLGYQSNFIMKLAK